MAPKIAIMGAGPGGCMLARLLHQHSISCTIFESEKSVDYRSQGGTLDLRTQTGLQAIKEANLFPEFQKHARYDGESLLLCDKNKRAWVKRSPRKSGETQVLAEAPEIDRAELRRILMESVPDGTVRWGMKLKTIGSDLSLHFDNGMVETGFDLIVGADGAFSKTRQFLSSERPFYTGLGGYAMSIPDAATKAPEVYKMVNRGSVFAFSDMKSINGQQLGNGSISVASYGHFPEDFTKTCGFDVSDPTAVKKHLREMLHDWSPELKALFENTEGPVVWRNLYMLPVGFRWEHRMGVTLLGDAAHVMTPFGGLGVNNALNDALLLSNAIVKHTEGGGADDLDFYVQEYEEVMFRVTKKGAALTEGCMQDMMLTPGAPRARIGSYVTRHATAEFSGWLHPVIAAVVHVVFFFYKLVY